jgi:hypothetical protein
MDLQWMGYVGCVVRVSCSLIGQLCVAQSCSLITVFRMACCTSNVSAVGLLMQGVDTTYINQSFKKNNSDVTFLVKVPSIRSYELKQSPSQSVLNILQQKGCNGLPVRWLRPLVGGSLPSRSFFYAQLRSST